jgi:hypothetical protein
LIAAESSPSDEPVKRWIGKDKPAVTFTRESIDDYPEHLYTGAELLMLEGDYSPYIDGDWNRQHEPKDNK